jgi:hypothetical protein
MIAQAPLSTYNKNNKLRRSKTGQTESELKHKFMQTIGDEMFKELEEIANKKGIRVQTLLRAVIIPEWAQKEGVSMDPRLKTTRAQTSNREKSTEYRLQEF